MRATKAKQQNIFILADRADQRVYNRVIDWLKPLHRNGQINVIEFEDANQMVYELETCTYCIVLISQNFINSPLYFEGRLMELFNHFGVLPLCLVCGVVDWNKTCFTGVQWVNNPETPFSKLRSHKIDEYLLRVSQRVMEDPTKKYNRW